MPDRFFAPGTWQTGDELELPEGEAQHISRVLRMKPGQSVELFNGLGAHAFAELVDVGKRRVSVRVDGDVIMQPVPEVHVTLAVASPKGDRFRWMLEKLTELGVDRLIPLRTERGVVDPRDSKLEKLEQNVIAACKQCRRDRLMEITPVQSLSEVLAQTPRCCLFGDAAGEPLSQVLASSAAASSIVIVVGPEGGLTAAERDLLRGTGSLPVRVGRHVLRIETAAVALAAAALSMLPAGP